MENKKPFNISRESLDLTRRISDDINNQTFHHHYHILYDIANSYDSSYEINYLEIGCYAGGSACLLLQRPRTSVISIDLGKPISKNIVIKNVNKLNKHKNKYNYIEGSSHEENTQKKLDEILNNNKIDILFIDGDHSYNGVKKDFEIYSKYVKSGGYIIFDDYNDFNDSPEVKKSVDELNLSNYEILGEFGNEFGARPTENKPNEFVVRKKDSEKIAIIISTYFRPDGKTSFFLNRNLKSLREQTDKDFKIFLIGDKYENKDEFISYSNLFDNIYTENLKYAKEREKYKSGQLWCSGGVNAVNIGLNKALSEGYNWVINMDHDDYFLPTHIEDIKKLITNDCVFICSKSNYRNSSILPQTDTKDYIPMGGGLIKSSACVNFSKINIRFRDVYEEEGKVYPSDADFWNRLNEIINNKKYESFCTGSVTCIHDEEGYTNTAYR